MFEPRLTDNSLGLAQNPEGTGLSGWSDVMARPIWCDLQTSHSLWVIILELKNLGVKGDISVHFDFGFVQSKRRRGRRSYDKICSLRLLLLLLDQIQWLLQNLRRRPPAESTSSGTKGC